jgi:tetratricopeptide (TPR) repeat protein
MSVETAIFLQEQAWSLQAEGRLDEARIACREALRRMEEADGPESADVANLLGDLAEIENERQEFETALALAGRAEVVLDSLWGRLDGETATRLRIRIQGLLGSIRRTLGDYEAAETGLLGALTEAMAGFGAASAEAVEARINLGILYKHWGRFEEGLQLYRDAQAYTGEDTLERAAIYHNIGGILHAQGDLKGAEEPARKAWEISRKLLGEDDPRTALDAAACAVILDGLGKSDESESIYRRALLIFEKRFGPQHYEVAANLHNLAALLDTRGNPDEAEQLYRRALAIKEMLTGTESPDAALTRHNLGNLLRRAGRPADAVPLLESAVATLEKRLTPGHPHLILARENLRKARKGVRMATL